MIRLNVLFWASLLILTLCGCQYAPPRVWTDTGTGCQYLITHGAHEAVLTPRLAPNGRQVCK